MYKIGASFDPENAKMVDVSQLQNMDFGFEAYATQAFNAPDGRALAVSWLGLPDVSYPSDRFDHQGTFSLVKELTIKDGKGLSINFDLVNGQVTVDRSQAGEQYAQEFGTTRSCSVTNQATTVNIFIDNSVFEIFINKGEKVFSGRVFPHEDQNGILIKSGNPTGTYYELEYGRKTN